MEILYKGGKKLSKVTTIEKAIAHVKDGMTVMVGGFLGCGMPIGLTEAIVQQGKKSLTLVCNDTAFPDVGVGKWVVAHQIKRAIVSHIGTNPETGRQIFSGEMQVDLVPQGTLALRINAGGSGLGGVLTPTGVGTVVEEGKQKLMVQGREYLLELPLRADVALLYAAKADTAGNLVFRRSARNFNPIMAMAAECVIAEVGEIVEPGQIDPDEVMVPGVVVDWIIPRKGV